MLLIHNILGNLSLASALSAAAARSVLFDAKRKLCLLSQTQLVM